MHCKLRPIAQAQRFQIMDRDRLGFGNAQHIDPAAQDVFDPGLFQPRLQFRQLRLVALDGINHVLDINSRHVRLSPFVSKF